MEFRDWVCTTVYSLRVHPLSLKKIFAPLVFSKCQIFSIGSRSGLLLGRRFGQDYHEQILSLNLYDMDHYLELGTSPYGIRDLLLALESLEGTQYNHQHESSI